MTSIKKYPHTKQSLKKTCLFGLFSISYCSFNVCFHAYHILQPAILLKYVLIRWLMPKALYYLRKILS